MLCRWYFWTRLSPTRRSPPFSIYWIKNSKLSCAFRSMDAQMAQLRRLETFHFSLCIKRQICGSGGAGARAPPPASRRGGGGAGGAAAAEPPAAGPRGGRRLVSVRVVHRSIFNYVCMSFKSILDLLTVLDCITSCDFLADFIRPPN